MALFLGPKDKMALLKSQLSTLAKRLVDECGFYESENDEAWVERNKVLSDDPKIYLGCGWNQSFNKTDAACCVWIWKPRMSNADRAIFDPVFEQNSMPLFSVKGGGEDWKEAAGRQFSLYDFSGDTQDLAQNIIDVLNKVEREVMVSK
jgi:hypothetical protein